MYTPFIRTLNFLLLTSSTALLMIFSNHFLLIWILLLSFVRLFLSIKNEAVMLRVINFLHFSVLLFLLITDMQIMYSVLVAIVTMLASIIFIIDLKIFTYKNKSFFRGSIKFILNFVALSVASVILVLSFLTMYPKPLYNLGKSILGENVITPRESYITTNNYLIHKNISYPSSYENNKLDIYQTINPKGTLFFVHGGGYTVYDKSHRNDYLIRYVAKGYNVVNINYSLFPNTAYPDTIKQVYEAYDFIITNASVFGIGKNKIFLSGDSSGGQLAGQLALLLTNNKYANNMGIEISSPNKPLAFIGVATMFDPTTANKTNFAPINWLFDIGLRDYFNTDNLSTSGNAREASLLHNINENFPATFISDGNFASFDYQAKEFDKKLKSLGVYSELYLIESDEILQHGFELDVDNSYAQNVFEKQIEFMDKQVKNLE